MKKLKKNNLHTFINNPKEIVQQKISENDKIKIENIDLKAPNEDNDYKMDGFNIGQKK